MAREVSLETTDFAGYVAQRWAGLNRFAYAVTGNAEDAADAVQDALTGVYRSFAPSVISFNQPPVLGNPQPTPAPEEVTVEVSEPDDATQAPELSVKLNSTGWHSTVISPVES
jgi:hypothetical protein